MSNAISSSRSVRDVRNRLKPREENKAQGSQMHRYGSIVSAAKGLLGEVITVLGRTDVGEFAVIGGWSAFLLNSGRIQHPGSRDVDILFQRGLERRALESAIRALRTAGFLLSAKHEFQLLRQLNVRGTTFVFNVDLLHPGADEPQPELFAEHVSLPIPLSEYTDETYSVMSIVVPQAAFIFDGHVEPVQLDCVVPSGKRRRLAIPLMNELGLITTKAKSMSNPKRPRDSFDVFLAIEQSRDYRRLLAGFRLLKFTEPLVFNSLFSIRDALEANIPQANAVKYFSGFARGNFAVAAKNGRRVGDTLRRFLRDIPLPTRARTSYSRGVL